jgi:AraC family transcriptional regulator of adaptative response / DNA-3-methyladenine glycosylase II
LKDLGLTPARSDAVRALARAVRDGVIGFNNSEEDVTRALTKLPGVGAWTAHYVALRGLGDAAAFLTGDLILRRAAATRGPPLTARVLEARAESWRPWRGYAVMHLWAAAPDSARGRGPRARARAPTVPFA